MTNKINDAFDSAVEQDKDAFFAAVSATLDVKAMDALSNFTVEEEAEEQIDELSKDTLKSYVKKASSDTVDKAHRSSELADMARQTNSSKKKEHFYDRSDMFRNALNKRLSGIGKAADKLGK